MLEMQARSGDHFEQAVAEKNQKIRLLRGETDKLKRESSKSTGKSTEF